MKYHTKWKYAVLSVTLVGALAGCGGTGGNQATASQGIPAQLIKLSQAADAGLSGKINPDQEIKVVSRLSGKVASVAVLEGAKVKKGDVLLELETDDLQQQVKQAEAALTATKAKLADTQAGARAQEVQAARSAVTAAQGALDQATAAAQQAKAAFELSTSTYNRLRNMYDSNSSVTKDDLDRGTFDYEKAKASHEQAMAAQKSAAAQVEAAQAKLELTQSGATAGTIQALQAEVDRLTAALELANNALANATILAPADGIVVKRAIQPGEMAQPGVALLTVVNMKQVQIELSVAENLIGKVKEGTAVDVKVINIPEKAFTGVITFVSPISNPNSSTFPVKVTVDNSEELLFAGMVAEVHMKQTGQSKLEVPASAVIKKDNKQYVIQSSDQTAHWTEITTSAKNSNWLYLESGSGLQSDAQIVVNPSEAMVEGAKLKAE
jgi:HlyD family secretion protein